VAEHKAIIEWECGGGFAENSYSRAHAWRFDGGAVVPASSSPSVVPLPMSDPAGVDPEEALVAAASSCHMLWFLHLAREGGFVVLRYRDEAAGTMGKNERGRMAIVRIALRPSVAFAGPAPGEETLAHLHREAHERCFIANSLCCEIVVEPL
jgi:organic hydroperoxide reductase OsmC/OhrA